MTRLSNRFAPGVRGGCQRALCLLVLGLWAALPAWAVKIKVYSLAELVQTAEVIARVEIRIADGSTNAVLDRTLKGQAPDQFPLRFQAYRPGDVSLTDRQQALVFLQRDAARELVLVGYGDQGVWPKRTARWPATAVHVVPLAKVEDVVQRFLRMAGAAEQQRVVEELAPMLGSPDPFYQLAALEFLEQTKHEHLAADCRPQIEGLQRSGEAQIRATAVALHKRTAPRTVEPR